MVTLKKVILTSNWTFVDGGRVLENLCDHPVVIRDEEGNELTLMAAPRPAKCSMTKKQVGLLNMDDIVMVPIVESEFTEVQNLPAPDKRRIYIVSLPVAKKLPERHDLYVPNDLAKAPHGNEPLYCRSLARPL